MESKRQGGMLGDHLGGCGCPGRKGMMAWNEVEAAGQGGNGRIWCMFWRQCQEDFVVLDTGARARERLRGQCLASWPWEGLQNQGSFDLERFSAPLVSHSSHCRPCVPHTSCVTLGKCLTSPTLRLLRGSLFLTSQSLG